jgi:hypothetical protein
MPLLFVTKFKLLPVTFKSHLIAINNSQTVSRVPDEHDGLLSEIFSLDDRRKIYFKWLCEGLLRIWENKDYTRVLYRRWLRHYTIRMVAGSSPEEVITFLQYT